MLIWHKVHEIAIYRILAAYYKTLLKRRPSWIEDTPKGLKKEYKTLLITRPNSATVWNRDMYNTFLESSEHIHMESGRFNPFWEF